MYFRFRHSLSLNQGSLTQNLVTLTLAYISLKVAEVSLKVHHSCESLPVSLLCLTSKMMSSYLAALPVLRQEETTVALSIRLIDGRYE